MPSVVTIEGVGEIEFPDGISPEEISKVSEEAWLQAGGYKSPPARLTDEQLKDPAAVKAYVDALNARSNETRQAIAARDAQPMSDAPQGFWKTVRQPLADPALSVAKGVVGVPEAAVGLADIPTGGRVGRALEETIGYDPKFTKDWISGFYSPEQQAANAEVAKAKGFFNTVRAMGENPSTVANQVAESIPAMLGGAAIGRGALALAPRIGPVIAGAIGEGAVAAGQNAEQLRQESESGLLTPKQSVLAATSGAATGLIGVLGGGLARRLGVTDIDTLLAGGGRADAAAKKNILRRISESALSEGLLEELPQSAQELVQENVASGRPWNEGVAEASAQGLLAGLVMGGAGGGLPARPRKSLRDRESILRRGEEVPRETRSTAVETTALPVQQPIATEVSKPAANDTPVAQSEVTAKADITVQEYPDGYKLAGITVPPEARGKGIGTAAVRELVQKSEETGKPIYLTAHADSAEAQPKLNAFYERLGFEKYSEDPLSKKPMYRYVPKQTDAPKTPTPAAPPTAAAGALADAGGVADRGTVPVAVPPAAGVGEAGVAEVPKEVAANVESSNVESSTQQTGEAFKQSVAIDDVLERARQSISTLPPERQELVQNFMDNEHTSTHAGFEALQRELDTLDAQAPSMTEKEWRDKMYFQSPNTLMRWGHPEERPLTRQEAAILNAHKAQVESTNRLRDYKKNWPVVQAGDLPSTDQADALTSGESGGKYKASLWGQGRLAQYESLRKSQVPDKSFRETAESIAEKLEGLKSGRQAGDLQLFGVIPAVWDAAISIAQGIVRAGGTAADAIAAALAHIRSNNTEPFEEAKATEFIERVVQPQTAFTEPDANEAEPAGAQTVNIAGRTYEVISKDKLTDDQRKAADARAQEKFDELGIPGVADTTDDRRAGSINNNTVFRVVSDGQNHDAAVQELRTHLIDEIQRQHSQGGDPAYVGSLINAINMNFDHGRWEGVVSQPVLESLLDVSVGESSKSGTMLRRFRGISEDIRAVAQNAALRLKWEYAKALDPDNYAKGALTRIVEGIRKHLTTQEITNLALKIAKPEEAAPVVAAIRKAIAGDFASMSDVMKAAQAALIEAGMTEPQARKIVSEAETILGNTIRDGANAAIAQMREELTPEKKRGAAGRALSEIQKMLLNDLFGYGDLLARLAKSERWVVPSAKDFEQMRKWAKDEERLRTPTADEIAKAGGNAEVATDMVSAATLGLRRDLLRQMNSQWSQWTNPLTTSWRDTGDAVKTRNTNMALNEWVSANLLLKVGFGTRQVWDVGWQMVLNTPTRAISYAFESWQNDKAAGRDSSLQHSIAEAIGDAYRARIKVLVPALNAFKETLAGRGEHRKQVEQLISSIGIFDRALTNAAKMRAENKRGAANLLEIIAITARMGRQFAAAMDMFQGIPAETQELAHQIRNALREKMPPGVALEVQYDSIMGLLTAQRAEAISLAREYFEARGKEAKGGELEMAATRILREKLYHAAKQAGLKTDDWKKNNELYRDLIGWNLPETKGVGKRGGFGGLVALGGQAAKEVLSNVPLVGGVMSVPFTFSNAMGISLNRKLAWSPLGFFPGLFTGSPHWTGETNIRQRKIEAVLGTGISATLFSLIVAGVWKALPAFWPKDEKERDKWVRNGWQPGMLIIPWGNGQELHLSTRVGLFSFFAPAIAAAAAYTAKVEERAKKQALINERAKRAGLKPEQLPDLSAADWLGIIGSAAYSSVTGGRTASGALAAYTDFGTFNPQKAAAAITTALTPGLPALNEFGRMAGGNINPKLASFWDLLVPMPTSDAQRVNMLGDPMRDENDYRRVFQILSGGNFPFPTSATPAETQAYAALFDSDYRPPAINPGRGYNIGGRYRPFTAEELSKYTAVRGQNFKRELGALGASPSEEEIKAAFVRANDEALASVGVALPVRRAITAGRTRSRSRLRLGRTRRGGLRGLRAGRRGLRGLRKRRKRLVLR